MLQTSFESISKNLRCKDYLNQIYDRRKKFFVLRNVFFSTKLVVLMLSVPLENILV